MLVAEQSQEKLNNMKQTLIRSYSSSDEKFYYFLDGRYYKDEQCKNTISERICLEFSWSNAEWCTGLTDKNGKQIFEGDVLAKQGIDYGSPEWEKYEANNYNGEEPITTIKKDFCTLDKFRFWLENEHFGWEGEDLESPEYWLIIGNIHDNPELI